MNNISNILLVSLFLVLAGCGAKNSPKNNFPTYIGEAEILQNGTIIVHSFIQEVNGEEARAQIITEYKTNDPNYKTVKKHIGDLKVGETKLIRPFNE